MFSFRQTYLKNNIRGADDLQRKPCALIVRKLNVVKLLSCGLYRKF